MPRWASPRPRWSTTWAAVRLPLNLSGARRILTAFPFSFAVMFRRQLRERFDDDYFYNSESRVTESISVCCCWFPVSLDICAVFGSGIFVEHVGIVEGVFTGEHPIGLFPIDLLDPVRDDQSGHRVARE